MCNKVLYINLEIKTRPSLSLRITHEAVLKEYDFKITDYLHLHKNVFGKAIDRIVVFPS